VVDKEKTNGGDQGNGKPASQPVKPKPPIDPEAHLRPLTEGYRAPKEDDFLKFRDTKKKDNNKKE
jgi:hypothetical protein